MPRSLENSSIAHVLTQRAPPLPGAEGFMEFLMEQYDGGLHTRLVANTPSTETWDILHRSKHIGTYFRSGKAQGYPLRVCDVTIKDYVNQTVLALVPSCKESDRPPLDRVHLEFNTRADFGLMSELGEDGDKESVRYDGHKDIPFPHTRPE